MSTITTTNAEGADYLYVDPPPCPHVWQPIETAPKDKTWRWFSNGEWSWEGVWNESREAWINTNWTVPFPQPTHWMPLPPLPEVTE